MSLASDIRELLLSESTITNLISTRLYPLTLPQNPTLPALTYQKVSDIPNENLDGAMTLTDVRVQIDCWALSFLAVESLAAAVRTKLHGFQGSIGGSPPTRRVSGVFLDNERDFYESDTKLYRRSADYRLHVNAP